MRLNFVIILLCFCAVVFGQQRPFINSLDKTATLPGETVTISGSGFSGNMQVNFGAGVATISNSSSTLLEVVVPVNATYGPVTATDLNTGLSATSLQYFTPAFGGSGFDNSQTDDQANFTTSQQFTYDVCNCDFDGDGKIDAAVANNASPTINVYQNTSTTTSTTFSRIDIPNSFSTISNECADLNGDGKPEMVFSTNEGTNNEHIFIFNNTSSVGSISFSKTSFRLPNRDNGDVRNPRKFVIADVTADGKNDLVIGNESDNVLHIYKNTSTGSNITFDDPVQVTVPRAEDCGALDAGDLNNDGLIDLAVISFNDDGEVIYLLKNISNDGSVAFEVEPEISNTSNRTNIELADLDQDNKLDIVTTSNLTNEIDFFLNTSSGGNITYDNTPVNIGSISNPWGLSSGDLDGDGLVDIAVASTNNRIYVFENTSSTGSLSFSNTTVNTTSGNRNISVADLNGDGKPDLATTHNINPTSVGDFTVIANRNCLTPAISPEDLTFCVGNPFTLTASNAPGSSYSWSVVSGDATLTPSGQEVSVTVNSGTSVTVRVSVTSADGDCTDAVNASYTLTGGSPPAAPTITNSNTGTICSGQSFTLTGPTGQDEYLWTLPDGSETSLSTNALVISNATSSESGIYQLRVKQAGSCVSETGELSVAIDEPPSVVIDNGGEDDFCETSSVQLSVPNYDGFSYQWKLDGADVNGATSNELTASASGAYSVVLTSDISTCEKESPSYNLNAVAEPASNYTSVDEICAGVSMDFEATSTGENGFDLNYAWDFGDGNNATGQTTSHTFASEGTYDVVLTTAYDDVDACLDTFTKTVTVTNTTSVDIIIPNGSTEKCPSDSIRLELPQGYQSYNWSTGDTTYFTYAKTAPNQSSNDISVDMVTDIGCALTSQVTISNFANSGIEITTQEATIVNDTIELASGVASINLSATNGSDFIWSPEEALDVTTGPMVRVTPRDMETVVTVTGTDTEGCSVSASVTIITPGVIPRKTFSPNGDNLGFECWEILNTENLEGCQVYIFDQRGVYVFEGNSPFTDNCVWNGNIDGGSSPAPAGIYYFVMKCENSNFEKTGTILLGR